MQGSPLDSMCGLDRTPLPPFSWFGLWLMVWLGWIPSGIHEGSSARANKRQLYMYQRYPMIGIRIYCEYVLYACC